MSEPRPTTVHDGSYWVFFPFIFLIRSIIRSRLIYEREARAFAAELLMPFAEVSRHWFALSLQPRSEGELSVDDQVQRLAEE